MFRLLRFWAACTVPIPSAKKRLLLFAVICQKRPQLEIPETSWNGTCWIMFWRGGTVKFGGAGLCPKWYVRVMGWGEESGNECVRGTPGRAGEVRADVWEGTREAGGVTGPDHECAGTGGTTRGVLHEPKESDGAGDGFADGRAGIDACEGVGAGGDGGDEEEEELNVKS